MRALLDLSGQVGGAQHRVAGTLDAEDDAFVGIGAGDETVLGEPVGRIERAHLGGKQGEHRGEGKEAEVLAIRNAEAAALGHLEEVADLETADRAALDRRRVGCVSTRCPGLRSHF